MGRPPRRYDDGSIFFSLFINIAYSSYTNRIVAIKERFPYDAVTRKTTREVRSLIAPIKMSRKLTLFVIWFLFNIKGILYAWRSGEAVCLPRCSDWRSSQNSLRNWLFHGILKKRFGIATGDTLTIITGSALLSLREPQEKLPLRWQWTDCFCEGEYHTRWSIPRPEEERSFTVTDIF